LGYEEIHINEWTSELRIIPFRWYSDPEEYTDYDSPFIGVYTSTVRYMINDPDDK